MKRKSNCLATILFLIYLALLVWIILFKLQFSISDLDKVRSINLIPFHYDKEIGAAFHLTEVLENFLIFCSYGHLSSNASAKNKIICEVHADCWNKFFIGNYAVYLSSRTF